MTPISGEMVMRYQGNDADYQVIDATQFSKSVGGFSRLYSHVAHYCVYGSPLKSRQVAQIRCYSAPSREGSYESIFILAPLANEYQMFADVYRDAIDWLIAVVMGHIKDALTGRGNVEKLIDVISAQAAQSSELSTLLAQGLIKSNDNLHSLQERLIETIPNLVHSVTPTYRQALSPVGKSCLSVTQFPGAKTEIVVTEADALAIRSDSDMVVGDAAEYFIHKIEALNLKTGSCRILLQNETDPIIGKIVDPALSQPDNVYSHALNSHTGFKVRAKPVFRDNDLYRLFISEA